MIIKTKKHKIKNFLNKEYKYGFKTKIKINNFPLGLNKKIIKLLSKIKKEPTFILDFRLKAYKFWKTLKLPQWANLKINPIDYKKILYYSHPKEKLDPLIFKMFNKLGFSLDPIPTVAIEAVFDSISIITTYKEQLAKQGIIFCSISEAIKLYPNLIKKYLGSVVSLTDNYFSTLNSIIFTDGSFCYIPQNTICPLELSTYFRINNPQSGQFERTLIIVEKNSSLNYLEGCTAIKDKKNQLHAAVIELIVYDNSKIKYSTIQNWYSGNYKGEGGIYNFVTKRGLALGKYSNIQWTQVETGSSITWKYPSSILLGSNSASNFYSITLTNNYQQSDTGTKMIHLGKYTQSKIIAKGIASNFSQNSYRGLVKVAINALYSRNFSQCDSFIIGSNSKVSTYPYIDICNSKSIIEHEAKISKLNEDQLFYLLQRGIDPESGYLLLMNGFCKEVLQMLPFEFAIEATKILALKLENSII